MLKRLGIKCGQSLRPINRLSDTGQLEIITLTQLLHESHNLGGKRFRQTRGAQLQNGAFARRIRVIHPMIKAAPAHRIMHFACAVRCDDNHRRGRRFYRAKLRNRDLEISKDFQQEGFKRFIRAIKLINQQHGGAAFQRIQQGPRLEEFAIINAAFQRRAIGFPRCFRKTYRH